MAKAKTTGTLYDEERQRIALWCTNIEQRKEGDCVEFPKDKAAHASNYRRYEELVVEKETLIQGLEEEIEALQLMVDFEDNR